MFDMYESQPDYRNIADAARNIEAPRLPLYEHIIGGKVMREITGVNPYDTMFSQDMAESREGFRRFWDFWRKCGYDTVSIEYSVCGILERHDCGALGAHKPPMIRDRADFERFPWDRLADEFFEVNAPYITNLALTCPPGMKAVGGVANGVFEAVQDIVGYIDLCYLKSDDEELYGDLFRRMAQVEMTIWKRFIAEYSDVYCVLRFGDDLGFKSQTLLSPGDVRKYIIPAYAAIIAEVHRAGKPFLLHSCGCIFDVMDDLIGTAKIDAKHSNEDQIARFPVWVERYGDRIGNFGGVDTDVLCRCDEKTIRDYVLDVLEKVKGHGGIAFGSGNSIPDYVPTSGFLAMVNTVREWRGDRPAK